MRQVETFPDGATLLEHCNEFGLEGVVSKRASSRYVSGPSRHWVKVKCPNWKRDHGRRWRAFNGHRVPELTDNQKSIIRKRQMLERLLEQLREPDLSAGYARELRKQVLTLEREIAELEGKG